MEKKELRKFIESLICEDDPLTDIRQIPREIKSGAGKVISGAKRLKTSISNLKKPKVQTM